MNRDEALQTIERRGEAQGALEVYGRLLDGLRGKPDGIARPILNCNRQWGKSTIAAIRGLPDQQRPENGRRKMITTATAAKNKGSQATSKNHAFMGT